MTVTVCTQPNCYPCKGTLREMDKLGVEYNKVDITEHQDVLDMMKARGFMSTPIIVVQDDNGAELDIWSGHKLSKVRSLVH